MPSRAVRWYLCVAAACLLVAAATAAEAGPVNYRSQDRRVIARLQEFYPPDEPGAPLVEGLDQKPAAAPDFGDFDGTATAEIDDVPPGQGSGTSVVSMHSRLDDAGITAAGRFDGFVATEHGAYAYNVAVDVTLELTEPAEHVLSYLVEYPLVRNPTDEPISIFLRELDENFVVFEEEPRPSNREPVAGTRAGSLGPGRYRFFYRGVLAIGPIVDGHVPPLEYSVGLSLSEAPGPTPIPLPPVTWAALTTMAALGAARRIRQRG